LCGAILAEVWPGVENLDLFSKLEIPRGVKRRVKERLKPYVKVEHYIDYTFYFIKNPYRMLLPVI
jgi:cyclin-dependent kinase 9